MASGEIDGNADRVRRLYETFNAGEDASALLAEDVEYVNPPEAIEGGTRRGVESWRDAMRNVRASFDSASIEIEHMLEAGERGACVVQIRFRGKGSGVETTVPQGHVWTFRDGLAVRFEWHTDPRMALDAIRGGPAA